MALETALATHLIPVVGIVSGILFLIVWTVAEEMRKVRIAEQTAVLKRLMIEKGYSAEEIVAVIRATPGHNKAYRENGCRESKAVTPPVS